VELQTGHRDLLHDLSHYHYDSAALSSIMLYSFVRLIQQKYILDSFSLSRSLTIFQSYINGYIGWLYCTLFTVHTTFFNFQKLCILPTGCNYECMSYVARIV
jgi:hypothetical protein